MTLIDRGNERWREAGGRQRAGSIAAPRAIRWRAVWLLPLCLCLLAARNTAPVNPAANSRGKEAELSAVRERIEGVRKSIQADAEQRDSLVGELKQADERIQQARMELADIRGQRLSAEQELAQLQQQQSEAQLKLQLERDALSRELRLSYMNGRSEPLKLLLNQQDPAQIGRMLGYYGYFGRARAEQIGRVNDELAHLALLAENITTQTERLRSIEASSERSTKALTAARQQRAGTLAKVETKLKNGNERLSKLQADAKALERLIEQLRLEAERAAAEARARAAQAGSKVLATPAPSGRGSWPWPVKGDLLARFGQLRSGGPLKWEGLMIGSAQGTQVRAPAAGRVLYSDWLPGLGLLLVLDHGGGIMSLYGHNEQLYKKVGDNVVRGDVLSVVGDTGVAGHSGVYLEIRNGREPVDPLNWLGKP